MINGDIGNELLPTVVFHSSYLFHEETIFIFKRLKIKPPLRNVLVQALNNKEINVAVMCDEADIDLVEEALTNYHIAAIYTYRDLEDIKMIANQRSNNIVAYFDEDNGRGFWFGGRWRYA
jgi:hypothetical protein